MALTCGCYRFSCQLLDTARLPTYKGSTFRGAFGAALKRVVCTVRERECDGCLLRSRCIYALTFEYFAAGKGARIAARPHPYVIEPPLQALHNYQPGEAFDFTLLLFGEFNNYLPYYIYAFEQMGKSGIGAKVDGRRARFTLRCVTVDDHCVYSGEQRQLQEGDFSRPVVLPPVPAQPVTKLKLECVTPLRLKTANRFKVDIDFTTLIKASMRRVSSLFAAYAGGEPPLDYRGLAAASAAVECVENNLRWHDWKRYSNRHQQQMLMGGVVGDITFCGEITPFIPLLQLAAQLHLGKQTAFGLGQVICTDLSATPRTQGEWIDEQKRA